MTDSSGGSAKRVEKLILDEIADENSAEETQRLLGTSARGRTEAARSILLSILDHIAEYDSREELSKRHESLRLGCDAAIARNSGATDTVTPAIVGLLGLMCVNIRLLEARFREPGAPDQRGHFEEETQRYCEEQFNTLPVSDAVRALYAPPKVATRRRRDGGPLSPEEEQRQVELKLWNDIDFGTVKYYKSGTTSFILDCRGSQPKDKSRVREHYALKCVLFPWNKLTAIATATDKYAEFYGRNNTPEVVVQPFASTARWVLMPFQEGRSLYDELTEFDRGKEDKSVRKRIDKALSTGKLLIQTLDRLTDGAPIIADQRQRQHQDLSPGNIILAPGGQVRLIDLGPNHLYTRQIGITEHDDAAYVAPEIKNRGWSAVADVYSLGIILIRIICGYAPRDGRVPDEVWDISPPLARLLEDLVEVDPGKRLLLTQYAPGAPFSYGPLCELFDYTAEVVAQDPDISSAVRIRWGARLLPSSMAWQAQLGRWRASRRRRSSDAPRESYLLSFVFIATLSWWFIFIVTAFISGQAVLTGHGLGLPQNKGQLAADIICFNQGLIGAKYYSAVLGNLTVWKIPGKFAKTTEVFIRSMSVVALPITIVSAIWKPWLWPWAITAGAVVVVIANWLMLILAERIYRSSAKNHLSITPPDARLNAHGFEQWWWTMLLYAVVLAVIALGLQLHWMRDTAAYVFGLTVISIGIHYLSKFVAVGAAVRGGLGRAFCTGERMLLLQSRGTTLDDWPPRLATDRLGRSLKEAAPELESLLTSG
jgi:Protein kinase domain